MNYLRLYLKSLKKRNTDGKVPGVQSEESFLKPGEHIAVYWVQETNTFVWYLGIVEQVKRDIARIIHLKRSDKLGVNWIIPDDPEKLDIEHDQVLARDLPVIYHGVSCRIEISKALAKEITDTMEQIHRDCI